MSNNKLRPVSELQRKFLAKLGETAAEHQQQVLALMKKVPTTKVKLNVHQVNKQVERKLTWTEPSSEIASKLARHENFEEAWIPEAYVLFIRRYRCACGAVGSCLDLPVLFLRHRRRHYSARSDLEHGSPRVYKPTKVLAYPHLPRLKEVRFVALSMCEHCFEQAKVPLNVGEAACTKSESYQLVNTGSSGSEATAQSVSPTAKPSPLPLPSQALSSSSKPEELVGCASHNTFTSEPNGSDLERFENEGGPALATD